MPILTRKQDDHMLKLQKRLDRAIQAVLDEVGEGDNVVKLMSSELHRNPLQPTGEQVRIIATFQVQPKEKTP